jgi:hypothetical protein
MLPTAEPNMPPTEAPVAAPKNWLDEEQLLNTRRAALNAETKVFFIVFYVLIVIVLVFAKC